jgi:hypothetical protein
MMSAEIALQKALRARLVATPAVIALVPAGSVLDRNERPAPDPSIVIGEATSQDDGAMTRNRTRIFADIHIWKREVSTAGTKEIAGSISAALKGGRLVLETGFHCVDAYISRTRFLRDPDGETSHGIMTVEAIVEETA